MATVRKPNTTRKSSSTKKPGVTLNRSYTQRKQSSEDATTSAQTSRRKQGTEASSGELSLKETTWPEEHADDVYREGLLKPWLSGGGLPLFAVFATAVILFLLGTIWISWPESRNLDLTIYRDIKVSGASFSLPSETENKPRFHYRGDGEVRWSQKFFHITSDSSGDITLLWVTDTDVCSQRIIFENDGGGDDSTDVEDSKMVSALVKEIETILPNSCLSLCKQIGDNFAATAKLEDRTPDALQADIRQRNRVTLGFNEESKDTVIEAAWQRLLGPEGPVSNVLANTTGKALLRRLTLVSQAFHEAAR